MKRALSLFGALMLLAQPLDAQRTFKTIIDDFDYAIDDVVHVWTRPFHIGQDDLVPLATIAGGAGLVMLVDSDIQTYLRDNPDGPIVKTLEVFGEDHDLGLARAGDSEHLLQLSGALYLTGFIADSRPIREAALGCASADFANTTARSLLYDLVARRRPSIREDATGTAMVKPTDDAHQWDVPGGDWNQHSFFGGHAANIMTCVSFWNHRFDLGLAEPLLYALASGVGLARTVEEKHWTSDTLLGMTFGWAIGREVAKRYERRERRREGGELGAADPYGEPVLAVREGAAGEQTLYIGWRVRFQ